MKLVIVESPAKSKTIEGYLGKDFKVLSSVGHIRDLSTSGSEGLGVDVNNEYAPTYKNITGKSKVINELKAAAKKAEQVYIATDPDREGEAIGWHIAQILELDMDQENRIVFNEINKESISRALDHPRKIDTDMFNSQQARRIIDRIVGFKLSKLLQRKIKSKSAGRVQSVALKLIVDLEKERTKFIPEEYWNFKITDKHEVDFRLSKINSKKADLTRSEHVENLLEQLKKGKYVIESITQKPAQLNSPLPFTTSSLQQDAANKLGYRTAKTMRAAQKLYEGVSINGSLEGLITYMRTDSTRISSQFKGQLLGYVESEYGKEYVGFVKEAKAKADSQDAHEAIRVTKMSLTPDKVKSALTPEQFKLYALIYERTLACGMKNAKLTKEEVIVENGPAQFKATGQKVIFDGFLKAYKYTKKSSTDVFLPNYEEKAELENVKEIYEQKFTEPPARYTEAKLVKKLEELGIGRPSTYATIIETIQKRAYVEMEGKTFVPTEQGVITIDALDEYFSKLINVEYTANMENELDLVVENKVSWVKIVDELYKSLSELVDKAYGEMEKIPDKKTGEMCPSCETGELVFKKGRYGEFVGCSNYPECKYIQPKEKVEDKEIIKCPKCEPGMICEKLTKRGKVFYGCNNFPKCKEAYWNTPINEKCAECGSYLTIGKAGKASCEKKHDKK
jgi:DNA topoisomerase-1